jgi:hypothetical protein
MASLPSLADLPKLGSAPAPANAIDPDDESTTRIDLAKHLDMLLADHEGSEMPGVVAEEKDCLDLAVDKLNDILQVGLHFSELLPPTVERILPSFAILLHYTLLIVRASLLFI